MFTTLPKGIGALGIGVILVGLNLARYWTGQRVSRFSTVLGVLALLLGALELAQPVLHLTFELPIFAILLLALGTILLGGALFPRKG
jgi:uncharacterized membrane protein HdeD (DUF308 family)